MQTEKRASSQAVTWGLAILFGVVGASLQQSVTGFVAGALFGVLFAQIMHLRTRTDALDQQIEDLKQRIAGLKAAPEERAEPTPKAAPAPAPAPAPKPAMAAAAPPATAQGPQAPRPVTRTAESLDQQLHPDRSHRRGDRWAGSLLAATTEEPITTSDRMRRDTLDARSTAHRATEANVPS